ncbi:MAG: Uma2 family endonuclease [Rhizobacter sp.]|nr:Uma2 family endonuclease [Chlorobiales bacterium]
METTEVISQYEQERGKPMPSINHSFVQTRLIIEIAHRYNKLYSSFSELSLSLQGKGVTPDICIYPRMKPDWQHDEIKLTVPPLVAIEIASPSQGSEVFEEKMKIYFDAGVKSFWLVRPMEEIITIFTPNQKPRVFSSGMLTDAATGLEISIDEIFQR